MKFSEKIEKNCAKSNFSKILQKEENGKIPEKMRKWLDTVHPLW